MVNLSPREGFTLSNRNSSILSAETVRIFSLPDLIRYSREAVDKLPIDNLESPYVGPAERRQPLPFIQPL